MNFNQWATENVNLVGIFNITLTILLTALNVWFARNSQKYSAESLKQNEKIRYENNTPNIVGYFDSTDLQLVSFILTNRSENAAKNIKISLTTRNGARFPDDLKNANLLNEGVAFLAPGQSIDALTGSFIEIMDESKNFPSFDIQIDYQDIDSNSYSRAYVLDLNMYKGNFSINEKGLHELNKQVDMIEKHIRKAVSIYGIKDKRERESLKNNSRRIRS
jgi:Na+/phosphate symporter